MTVEPQQEIDISVVVTAHAEGRLAHRTMRSVQVAIDEASTHGLRTEIIIVLDNPTAETTAYFERWRDRARVLDVNNRDPGINRNSGVAIARGKYVAIIDADDLMGQQWLYLAYVRAENTTLPHFIVHAEITVYFGNRHELERHLPSNSPELNRRELVWDNYWTSVLLAPKATFKKFPFHPTAVDSGFGYEDWHWISCVLADGGEVLIATGACKFTRYKTSGSRLNVHDSKHVLIRPSRLFSPQRFLEKRVEPEACIDLDGERKPHEVYSESNWSAKVWVRSFPQRISRATEAYPPIQKTLGMLYRLCVGYEKGISRSALPLGLLEQWKAVSEIEPQLFPSEKSLEQMNWFSHSPEPAAEVYEQLCLMIAGSNRDVARLQFTHIYLVPWLQTGGADLVVINYASLSASDPANRVLILATEGRPSPWKCRLPTSVQFIDIGEALQTLRLPMRKKLLAQLLVQLEPNVIHLINSKLGNQVFEMYAKTLSQVSQLYAPAFSVEIDSDGTLVGYLITYLPEYAQYLTAIVSDNRHICDYLAENFALDPSRMLVHYQPIVIKPLPGIKRRLTGRPLHVLWASRLNRSKRPDLLLEIARQCQTDNIHFHVYGTAGISWDTVEVDFSYLPNVTYHGPFDGFSSLPLQDCDIFLYTSQWDGMPNILLEATAAGLPIISSNVGGISELIVQDETGLLVTPFDDIEQYVQGLRRLIADPQLGERLLVACRQLVAERHSWEHFAADVNNLPGYLEAPCQLEKAELHLLESPQPKPADASRVTFP